MNMSLEKVRDWHRRTAKNNRENAEHGMHEIAERWALQHDEMADIIDSHLKREAVVSDADVSIPLATLRWWRELVDINPRDLAPRMDSYLKGGNK